ncbi:hypothetical protein XENORESO_001414 [Xenotaenia resolanae]|uniref:Uncharacterized protein n=1 Tax=Xenotaenia resolanae TaxID=208358 RepID=A0ABV0WHY1_9TELE
MFNGLILVIMIIMSFTILEGKRKKPDEYKILAPLEPISTRIITVALKRMPYMDKDLRDLLDHCSILPPGLANRPILAQTAVVLTKSPSKIGTFLALAQIFWICDGDSTAQVFGEKCYSCMTL